MVVLDRVRDGDPSLEAHGAEPSPEIIPAHSPFGEFREAHAPLDEPANVVPSDRLAPARGSDVFVDLDQIGFARGIDADAMRHVAPERQPRSAPPDA